MRSQTSKKEKEEQRKTFHNLFVMVVLDKRNETTKDISEKKLKNQNIRYGMSGKN